MSLKYLQHRALLLNVHILGRLQNSGIFGDTQPVPRQGALLKEI